MLTPDEGDEISSLTALGCSISAIARHIGHDRKTVRAHVQGRVAGQRYPTPVDGFERFVPYVRARLRDDVDLPARTLYHELVARGFTLSYPILTARLRNLGLRPPKPPNPAESPVERPRGRTPKALATSDTVAVTVPNEPPRLTDGTASVLLRLLFDTADRKVLES